MSGRCKSCNDILEEWELKSIDPLTDTYTELCDNCISNTYIEDDLYLIDIDLIQPDEIL